MEAAARLSVEGYEACVPARGRIRRFEVFGERASGTNFVTELIALNTGLVRTRTLGWKHAIPRPSFLPRDLLLVVSVRDPCDWALSLHRRPWHAADHLRNMPFPDFIRAEWESVADDFLMGGYQSDIFLRDPANRALPARAARWLRARMGGGAPGSTILPEVRALLSGLPHQLDRHPVTGLRYRNIFEMRATKHRGFLGFRNRDCACVFVRHEVLRDRPEETLRSLMDAVGVPVAREFRTVTRQLGGLPDHVSGNASPTPDRIAPGDLEHIRRSLDPEVEAELGYPLPAAGRS